MSGAAPIGVTVKTRTRSVEYTDVSLTSVGSVSFGMPERSTRATSARSVEPYLRALVESGGSDLHVKVGSPPRVRIDGRLRKLQAPELTADDTEHMVRQVLRSDLVEYFERTCEADFAYAIEGLGRFRVNAFRQRGSAGMVFRRVSIGAEPLEKLGLPAVVSRWPPSPGGWSW